MSENLSSAYAGDTGESIRQLNSFLRGEISAEETYRLAVEKLADSTEGASHIGLLSQLQEDHGRAARSLRDRIHELGGEASDSSGGWGVWAKAVQGTANLFGEGSALKSLKEGEEHGLKDYRSGLNEIDPASAQLVQNQLIPAQERHITLLEQLLTVPHA